MKWVIVIVVIAALSCLLGMMSKGLLLIGTGGLLFGLHPDAYLRFTNTLLLFAIAIALTIKFSRKP
ncbi:hypothetical protein CH333_04915 [candidate division WOR-3 bacterium JGI_Cruoil_03_44_89]|uniref:Uncharacterized protein n=1 Tax=candidate division WOR-3 bacterium JGI_Cruoil_03_44_89 TaxID=1973748 RepID=A0A235BTV1_UNCW3|nr:MAG: hypothetical protein CH333_04915 [candidate division WOR-3 bacterium JGI_Cruoil_03_44_89]